MKTVRDSIQEAMDILVGPVDDAMRVPGVYERLRDAIATLDNSREITEKVTETYSPMGRLNCHYHVTNHKARVVLDD